MFFSPYKTMMITNPRLFVLQIRNNHVLIEIEFLFFPSIVHTALLSCLSQFNHDCYFSSIHPLAGSNYVRLLLDLPKFPISSQLVSSVIQDGPTLPSIHIYRERSSITHDTYFFLFTSSSFQVFHTKKKIERWAHRFCVCVCVFEEGLALKTYIYI